MSIKIVDGVELFIPSQDFGLCDHDKFFVPNYNFDFSDGEGENIEINKSPAAPRKIKNKRSKNKKRNTISPDAIRSEVSELDSKRVVLQPLDFSDLSSAKKSFRSCIEKALDFVDLFKSYIKVETLLEPEHNDAILNGVVDVFLNDHPGELEGILNKTNAEELYLTILHRFESEIALSSAKLIWNCKVLDYFPSRKVPMVLCVLQKGMYDSFPRDQFMVSYKALADLGIVPKNGMEILIPGQLICFSLFWGLARTQSSFGIIYRQSENKLGYYWVVYDRTGGKCPTINKHSLVNGNRQVFKAP